MVFPAFPKSSSREVRIKVPFFSVAYLSRGTLPQKKRGKPALLGDLVPLETSLHPKKALDASMAVVSTCVHPSKQHETTWRRAEAASKQETTGGDHRKLSTMHKAK